MDPNCPVGLLVGNHPVGCTEYDAEKLRTVRCTCTTSEVEVRTIPIQPGDPGPAPGPNEDGFQLTRMTPAFLHSPSARRSAPCSLGANLSQATDTETGIRMRLVGLYPGNGDGMIGSLCYMLSAEGARDLAADLVRVADYIDGLDGEAS